ncbi:MAG: hypothetical protein QOE72_4222 [Chloroflexota bacterium]|jgi:hypothetical protein|nr:hypothetical protein [Chloroflexota bacterium]
MHKELMHLGGNERRAYWIGPIGSPRTSTNKYEESLARSYLQFETIWCAVDPALCPA